MRIDLPVENWTEVFSFGPRPQLVELVPHIQDRKFISALQYFLHKCGELTLGYLSLRFSSSANRMVVISNAECPMGFNNADPQLPLPNVPMPKNITDFKQVHIRWFDKSVLAFLQKFRRNYLLSNVNFTLNHSAFDSHEPLWQAAFIAKLLRLITSFETIILVRTDMMTLFQGEFSDAKLAPARLLQTWNFWKPTMQYSRSSSSGLRTFVDITADFRYMLENRRTNEVLLIEGMNRFGPRSRQGGINISRYPMGATEKWITKMTHAYEFEKKKGMSKN